MDCEKKLYPIRQVSELTGVKPVTLRAWQRRYNLVQPERTAKGHRLYTDKHIALIGRIQGWLNKGVPISKVKALLDETDQLDVELGVEQQQLEEIDQLLVSLSQLNKTKSDLIVSRVLKEYPLSVVEMQFIQPVYGALNRIRHALRVIQVALLDSILVARLSSMIEFENKAAKSGKCLIVSCDSNGTVASRLWALKLSSQGWRIVIIEGVDDFSGLVGHDELDKFQAIGIYSSCPLKATQRATLEKLKHTFSGELLGSEFVVIEE